MLHPQQVVLPIADTLVTAWLSEYAGSRALQMMTPASQRQLRDTVHRIVADQGDVNVDEKDIWQILAAAESLQFGKATARGTQRIELLCRRLWHEAIVLGEATKPANRILLAIQSGTTEELEMDELTQILEYIVRQAGDQAEVVFGHGLNPALGVEHSGDNAGEPVLTPPTPFQSFPMIRSLRIVKIACDNAEDGRAGEEGEKASLPSGVPEGTNPFIVSVARRYQGQGLSMAELVAAGEDGWQRAQRHFGTATDQFERWGSRWVQESILLALCKGEEEAGPPA